MKALATIGGVLLAVALAIAVVYGGILVFGHAGRISNDIQRENTQHNQAYIQSKTQELLGLINDYEDPTATAGQKTATVNQFCYKVTLLIPEEWSRPIAQFEMEHC